MNIDELVTHYVTFRRTLGEQCIITENDPPVLLPRRRAGHASHPDPARVPSPSSWPAQDRSRATWHFKYSALKGFFRFAVSRGHLNKAPLPTELPKCPPTLRSRTFIHGKNFAACWTRFRHRADAPCVRVEPHTLRAMVLLMYGAGLRRGEALRLTAADVDLPNAVLTIRNTKFFKSRLVPIDPDLTKVLRDYSCWRAATHPSAGDDRHAFSSANKAKRFTAASLDECLQATAGMCRRPTLRWRSLTNLGCTTFATPCGPPPDRVVPAGCGRATVGLSPLRLPRACPAWRTRKFT